MGRNVPLQLRSIVFTVLFSSLGSHNKHGQTHRAFLHEATGGCRSWRAGTVCAALTEPVHGCPLAGSPAQHCLNGPVRLNGALRNGSQFSWSAGRRSAKAVCESLLLGGFHLFASAPEPWGGGLSFLSYPAPSVPVLHGGGHG